MQFLKTHDTYIRQMFEKQKDDVYGGHFVF